MREVFADTAYWIALTNPLDQHHEAAVQASTSIGRARLLTTDTVLIEYLNAFADRGRTLRQAAVAAVETIVANPSVRVLAQNRGTFRKGFTLYKARPDKGYSLTDCISMTVMKARRISGVLTTDRHFEQERFILLMAPSGRS